MVDLTNPFEAIENPTPEEILIVFAVGKWGDKMMYLIPEIGETIEAENYTEALEKALKTLNMSVQVL